MYNFRYFLLVVFQCFRPNHVSGSASGSRQPWRRGGSASGWPHRLRCSLHQVSKQGRQNLVLHTAHFSFVWFKQMEHVLGLGSLSGSIFNILVSFILQMRNFRFLIWLYLYGYITQHNLRNKINKINKINIIIRRIEKLYKKSVVPYRYNFRSVW